jgi:hypothetical protein
MVGGDPGFFVQKNVSGKVDLTAENFSGNIRQKGAKIRRR